MQATTLELGTEIEECERAWLVALERQDLSALNVLLHPEFTSTSARSEGELLRKAQYISASSRLKVCNHQIRDIQVFTIENVAIAKARLICSSKFRDQNIHDDLLITDVWLRVGHGWQVVTRHASNF